MIDHRLSRRGFVGVAAAGVLVGGCSEGEGGSQESRSDKEPPTPKPGDYRESPMLTELVEAGELPPLAERLPKEPYVVRPGLLVSRDIVDARPGRFGGTMQMAQESPTGDPSIFIGMNEPPLWAPSGFDYASDIEANVLASWEANADNSAFTFGLREGLRWSDGEPVTMEDVQFAFDDVLFNEDITPLFPTYLRAGRRSDAAPAELEVVDDQTFRLSFDRPYGTFPMQLAISNWISYGDIIKPRHYLEQFHQKYASKSDLQELLKEASIPEDQWYLLFVEKQFTGWMWNATTELGLGHPTLTPWVLKQVRTDVFTYERNPYYFKIDVEGNQLPYIDELRSQTVQDKETLTSRALFGEFDFLGERASARQLPLIAEKAAAGDIRLWIYPKHTILTTFFFNMTHPDENWRQVVRDVRFRQALNLAINRQEIIDNFYLGEFAQIPETITPGDHDVDEANRLLDEMGLDQKDGDGFRLGPDGERFLIPFELQDHAEETVPIAELLAEYWGEVGVFTQVRKIDNATAVERRENNELKAGTLPSHFPIWQSAGWDDYLPGFSFGPLWQEWYDTQGEEGEEPPAEVQQLFDLHEDFMIAEIGSDEFNDTLNAIIKHHYENVWRFSPYEQIYLPTFWTSRVKNTPEGREKGELYGIIATYSMEQWYIDE